MCNSVGRKLLKRRSTPQPPSQLPEPQPPASFAYPDGCWLDRRDLLVVLGALHDAALYDCMVGGSLGSFGRYRALSRRLGDDR